MRATINAQADEWEHTVAVHSLRYSVYPRAAK